MKNTELARRTLEHVEAIARTPGRDRWDQEDFGQSTDCGTTACFAGWAVVLTDGPGCLNRPGVESRAIELLGLTDEEADSIFYCLTDDPAELRAAVEDVFGPLPAGLAAAGAGARAS